MLRILLPVSLGLALCFASSPASAQSAKFTDGEIAAVVVTANDVDIRIAKIASKRAQHPKVRDFAKRMQDGHGKLNETAAALVTRLGIKPVENAVSKALQAESIQRAAHLNTLSGPEFDRAYLESEVDYHKSILDALDAALIPSASNAELKETLVQVRPIVQAHMEHARHLMLDHTQKAPRTKHE